MIRLSGVGWSAAHLHTQSFVCAGTTPRRNVARPSCPPALPARANLLPSLLFVFRYAIRCPPTMIYCRYWLGLTRFCIWALSIDSQVHISWCQRERNRKSLLDNYAGCNVFTYILDRYIWHFLVNCYVCTYVNEIYTINVNFKIRCNVKTRLNNIFHAILVIFMLIWLKIIKYFEPFKLICT